MTVRSVYASTEPGVQAGRIDTFCSWKALCALASVTLALACSSSARTPSGLPSGPAPAPAPPAPAPPVPTRWRISAPSAPAGFVIESRALVVARADSLMRADTVVTRTELRVTPRGAAIDVSVSTYVVQPAGGPARSMPAPVRAVGRFDTSGSVVFEPSNRGTCGSIAAAAIEATRELWVKWPADAGVGDRWRDSATVTICRDDIPLQLRLMREYRISAVSGDSAQRVFTVERRTTSAVSGRGPIRGDTTVVTATGTGSATLQVSAQSGWLIDGRGSSTLQLTARGMTRTQMVQQEVTTVIRRSPDGER